MAHLHLLILMSSDVVIMRFFECVKSLTLYLDAVIVRTICPSDFSGTACRNSPSCHRFKDYSTRVTGR